MTTPSKTDIGTCLVLLLATLGGCKKDGGSEGPRAAPDAPTGPGPGTPDAACGDAAAPTADLPESLTRVCVEPLSNQPEGMDAQHVACRRLCEAGSLEHCDRLVAVCSQGIPGGSLCPEEIPWAAERSCELGSGEGCMAASRYYREGAIGATADPARADALEVKACALQPDLCPAVPQAEAAAVLAELTAVAVPGGTFRPGYRPYDTPDEPQDFRLAEIAVKPFDIDRSEVTVGAYGACVNAGACPRPVTADVCNWGRPERLRHPMNCVTAGEAATFCTWRGRRLPSQDEWELAARGTDDRPYPWGTAEPADQLCWSRQGTCPVGSYPQGASPCGALDMEGNVQEWTTSTAFVTNVAVFYSAVVSRGGDWGDSAPSRMGLNNQHYHKGDEWSDKVGFRCVSPEPTEPAAPDAGD